MQLLIQQSKILIFPIIVNPISPCLGGESEFLELGDYAVISCGRAPDYVFDMDIDRPFPCFFSPCNGCVFGKTGINAVQEGTVADGIANLDEAAAVSYYIHCMDIMNLVVFGGRSVSMVSYL